MNIKPHSQIKNNIRSEKMKLAKIKTYLNDLEKEKSMNMVSIKELPECIVASKRTIIDSYNDLHQVAPEMGKMMKKHGAICSQPAYCFNIYHDDEYKEANSIKIEDVMNELKKRQK